MEPNKKYISQVELERPLDILPSVIEGVDYIFCIDGGGSKTEFQVLDKFGNIQPLFYGESLEPVFVAYQGSSNINSVGENAVMHVFMNLFNNLRIGPSMLKLNEVIPNSAIVAGIAGLGSSENKNKMSSILREFNFEPCRQALFSDASLTLLLVKEEGAILISGTGCICMSRMSNGMTRRAGGFGFPTEDLCGGFYYGKKAFNYAIQWEAGYGDFTSLGPVVRDFFSIDDESSIITFFRSKPDMTMKVASLAPLVFEHAYDYNDSIAMAIVNDSVNYLSQIISYCIENATSFPFKVFLVGGVFRDKHIDKLVNSIEEQLSNSLPAINIEWVNMSNQKIFPLIIQNFLNDRSTCEIPESNDD